MIAMVSCGQGLAIMPELMFKMGTDYSGCQVLRLEPAAGRSIGVACLSRSGLSPAASRFIEHARSYAQNVLRCGAYLGADEIVAVVKADEVALEAVGKAAFERVVGRIYHHTVGYAPDERLNVPGAHPYGYPVGRDAAFRHHLRKALARALLYALHAQHEYLVAHGVARDLLHKAAQPLRADGDYYDIALFYGVFEVAGELYPAVERDVFVFALFFEDSVRGRVLRPPVYYLVALDGRLVPRYERAPPAAAENGNLHVFHRIIVF